MDEEEIRQLFLEYRITLMQDDAKWLKEVSWGWPIFQHAVAQELAKNPERSLREVGKEAETTLRGLLIQKVVMSLSDPERTLLFNLSPFMRFTEEMARTVIGRPDAPQLVNGIAQKCYMLLKERDGRYAFIPFVRNALFDELKRRYPEEFILNQYRRAALYYESQGDIPEAVRLYILLRDTVKIKELLIRDTHARPSNGDYVALKPAYDILSEQDIASSPELMKGMEALWYCFTAVSTIGFGDVVVHTALSRVLTVLMSVYAVAALAIFTAVVVNYFQQVIARGKKEALEAFLEKAERLPELSREELEALARQARRWR